MINYDEDIVLRKLLEDVQYSVTPTHSTVNYSRVYAVSRA